MPEPGTAAPPGPAEAAMAAAPVLAAGPSSPIGLRHPDAREIAILMLSALGDAVHVLPVANALRRTYPRARISWIVQPLPHRLVAGHPAIDDFLLFRRRRGLDAFMQEEFSRHHLWFRVEVVPQAPIEKKVDDRQQAHSLMMRHPDPHRFPTAAAVVDGFIKPVPAEPAEFLHVTQIFSRSRRLDTRREEC